jgi:hypothetical protein
MGLLTAAGTASAATYHQGHWTLDAPGGSSYQAQVQQPINADGSSIFSAKSRTIPVKWKVTQTQSFTFESLSGATTVDNGLYSALSYTPPAGTTFEQITGLQAAAAFTSGTNHGGSLRWSVTVPEIQYQGQPANVFVYYGTGPNFTDSLVQNGNLIANTADLRVDTSQIPGGTFYDTWSHAVSLLTGQSVSDVSLVLDGGWGGDQVMNLSDASVTTTGGSSMFTWPAPIAGVAVDPSTVPMYVYLYEVSGNTPGAVVDENLVNTQGDTGGQYRAADGMYMYNFPVSNLPDKSATYKIGISTNSDGSSPFAQVPFGSK